MLLNSCSLEQTSSVSWEKREAFDYPSAWFSKSKVKVLSNLVKDSEGDLRQRYNRRLVSIFHSTDLREML